MAKDNNRIEKPNVDYLFYLSELAFAVELALAKAQEEDSVQDKKCCRPQCITSQIHYITICLGSVVPVPISVLNGGSDFIVEHDKL